MQAISEDFKAALKRSHQIVTKVEILSDGVVKKEITTALQGSVDIDRNASIRRRADFTLTDPDGTLVPTSSSSLLTPYGNEARLYRGVRLSSGDELVCLGTFRISKVRIHDADDGIRIDVQGYDRSRSVARARFTAPYQISSGTNYATAIQNLISFARPETQFNFASTAQTTPVLTFLEGEDPWKKATEMAESIGCEVFFDPLGVCTLQQVESSETPVWTYSEGSEAMFLSIDRDLDDEKTYNGVIATGEGPDLAAPVRSESWDSNSASPTYYLGQYGKVPFFYASPYILTADQAKAAADARLLNVSGATESVAFSSIVNPAHDVGDAVEITRAASGVGTSNSIFTLDSLTIPLEADREMTARVRERRSLT